MKQVLSIFLKYYFFWLAFFLFFKVFFLLYNFEIAFQFAAYDLIGVFSHGLIMDLSAAGYITLFPGLLMAFGFVLFPKIAQLIIQVYTLLVIIFLVIMGIGDSGLYADWGSRLNSQIFLYLQNPGGMYAAMNLWQIIALFILWFGFSYIWYKIYKRIFVEKYKRSIGTKWYVIPVLLILTTSLILPIRGGTNTSPLNHSSVYFSENIQANQSAYNFFWNFMYSVTQQKLNQKQVNYFEAEDAVKLIETSYNTHETYPVYVHPKQKKQVNVIVIILESFSSKIIETAGGLPNATPRLNALSKEGILFTNFYATGNRSDKGICALLGGYPSLMSGTTVLAYPDKMKRLYYFPKQFSNRNYNLSFFYGGDVNFYNTKTALIQSGFKRIVSNVDFPNNTASLQKWGVPDHHLYNRMFEELQKQKQPFFSMAYTISSHEPFDVPFQKIKGDDKAAQYLNSVAYSDSSLGVFIDRLKASSLWENTLVVITSDHCSLLPEPTSIEEPNSYRIPLIWLGGVIDTSFVCENYAMQNDLGPTLVQQMGWKDKRPRFSKNIFSINNYAFYFREAGWGFVSPKAKFFQNINTKKLHLFDAQLNQNTDSIINFAKAYVQYLHDDFIKN